MKTIILNKQNKGIKLEMKVQMSH